MFRNRRNSQKPNEELYQNFKRSFPDVGPGPGRAGLAGRSASLNETACVDSALRQISDDEAKNANQSTKPPQDSLGFTPSWIDPNPFPINPFANQSCAEISPSSGLNFLYHPQAGDLHTPTLGLNWAHYGLPSSNLTPLDSGIGLSNNFQPSSYISPTQFSNMIPFTQAPSFAPSQFLNQDSGYDNFMAESPVNVTNTLSNSITTNPPVTADGLAGYLDSAMINDKFRYNVTLRAPTAMVKNADEIPITYLNKGQAYSVSVVDTAPIGPTQLPLKYRTYIRVSFEDDQQRSKPATCWQLWKEGRGSNEAHHRGGKLLAVEYVDPNQGGDEETRHSQIELESASFDGFCVTWTPNPKTGNPDCAISVRFNFLSTDFSHSKGVKGIPVRLCAKTEVVPSDNVKAEPSEPEVCYAKVKLFRDHGAERKLSNDVAHVKKTMDKLKQQITQAELGMGNFGKRKRVGSPMGDDSRPLKAPKHKRTWSLDSGTDPSAKVSVEDDLQMKLQTMQDMFSSTRPVSILNLKGDEEDDPDLFPVRLSPEPKTLKQGPRSQGTSSDSKPTTDVTSGTSNTLSSATSPRSVCSPRRATLGQSGLFNDQPPDSLEWSSMSRHTSESYSNTAQKGNSAPLKVRRVVPAASDDKTGEWIEAIDIDTAYRPPFEHRAKPIACFYIRLRREDDEAGNGCYRAIYLTERTVKDLLAQISEKCQMDASTISRSFRLTTNGLRVLIDDEVIRELPEGQDMIVEFAPSPASKGEGFEADVNDQNSKFELNLIF